MVNPGHASRGCGTCKYRRVQCDAGRPTCQHCAQSRRICLGYIDSRSQTDHYPISADQERCSEEYRLGHSSSDPQEARSHQTDHWRGISKAAGQYLACRNAFISALSQSATNDKSHTTLSSDCRMLAGMFNALRQQAQDVNTRKTLLADYGQVTQNLRRALETSVSMSIALPVFFLCLYEVSCRP